MSIDWCVLRTSLFPSDFSFADASETERARFLAAIEAASSNPDLATQLGEGQHEDTRALYEARVRSRSVPRSLFAAAAMATPRGVAASMDDVHVHHRRGALPASDELRVSSNAVFHADGVTLYRRDASTESFEAVRVGIPGKIRDALSIHRQGSEAAWRSRLADRGYDQQRAAGLVDQLSRMGVLARPGECALWNDGSAPGSVGLHDSVAQILDPDRATPENVYASFSTPLRMPASVAELEEVGEVLMRLRRPEPAVIQGVLARQLDGRWLPLPELERMAEGLLREAAKARFESGPEDETFLRWLQVRALDPEIDLSHAPIPTAKWSGTMLMGTRWTSDGRLVCPTPFMVKPRELVGRYVLPGLSERLGEIDEAEPVVLAYRGPGPLGDVADVHVPGGLALEYCGQASDGQRSLRLEDIEVTATSRRILFRVREDQRPITLVRAIPYNDAMPGLHPLVCLLSKAANAERPFKSLIDHAFAGLPVRPRITYRGHILSRRSARLPRALLGPELEGWLRHVGLEGRISAGSGGSALPLDPAVDDAVRRDLVKCMHRRENIFVSEIVESEDLSVDGRGHAVHALVPTRVQPQARRFRPAAVPRPATMTAVRGPFRTLRVNALAERMPTVLRRLRSDLCGADFFYVFVSDAIGSELRLRIPRKEAALQGSLAHGLDELLDQHLIRHWAVEPYLREWDRYGGAEDIAAVEELFVADSISLYDPCTCLPLADERRTNLYTLAIIQTLSQAGLPPRAQAEHCREAFDSFSREFGYTTDDRRAVGDLWRKRRDPLIATAQGQGDPEIHSALLDRRERLQGWLRPGNRDRLRTHLRSVIHMTGTRLHFRDNRVEEAWAYFFARNLLSRWEHLPSESAATQAWRH
ncbi:MAG: thiopeptide-type bacteriocin biosynthesis protein [Myxococcota bacterium]